MKVAGVANLAGRPLGGVWYRAIQPQFWATALQTSHTRTSATRFNPGTGVFAVFYLAENHLVALMEVGALVGRAAPGALFPSPHRAWSVANVRERPRAAAIGRRLDPPPPTGARSHDDGTGVDGGLALVRDPTPDRRTRRRITGCPDTEACRSHLSRG